MTPRYRLCCALDEAEEKSPNFELDQIAWILARMSIFYPYEKDGFIDKRPRLAALVNEIYNEEEERRKKTAWDHVLEEVDRKRPQLNRTQVFLELSDWRNRDDRPGIVADLLIRIFHYT